MPMPAAHRDSNLKFSNIILEKLKLVMQNLRGEKERKEIRTPEPQARHCENACSVVEQGETTASSKLPGAGKQRLVKFLRCSAAVQL